jgi:SNF2 family DNA or RNA helicase
MDFKSQEIQKFVVFCQFIPDVKATAKAAKEAGYNIILFHGDVSTDERERRLAEFDETTVPTAFITQTAVGSVGISLTAASEAIFFSHTRNYAQFAQAKDRLHRIGQHHPVTYRHYITGVDQAIWIANRTKKDVADLLLEKPELLMQKGIDLKS